MEAWMYLRKSRAEEGDLDVLWKHRETLLELAQRDGVTIRAERIREEIGSGEHLRSRKVFRGLLEEWSRLPPLRARDPRRVVYAMEADRLSRGVLTERGRVQETLLGAGILIREPGGWCDLADPDQLLLHEVKGSLARHELLRYKERVEAARKTMTRQGLLQTGRPPMGYLWSKDAFLPIPDPVLFPVLVDACRRVLTVSVYRLAQEHHVNEDTLLQALRNPTIAGWPVKKWTAAEGVKKALAQAEWIWPEKPGDYPAACTLEEWHAIQRALGQRYKLRGKTRGVNKWCVDVVRFQGYEEQRVCCSALWRNSGRPSATPVPTYALRQQHSSLYIARDLVHEPAAGVLTRLLQDERLLTLAAQAASQPIAPAAPGRDQLGEEVERLRRRLTRLKLEWDEGDEEDAIANDAAQAEVKRDIGRLKAEMDRLRQPAPFDHEAHAAVLRWAKLGGASIERVSEEELRALARGLLKITIIIECVRPEARPGQHHRYERRVEVTYAEPLNLWLGSE